MIANLARRALASFTAWRARRRFRRSLPEVTILDAILAEHRRKHRPTSRLERMKRDLVRARLEHEQGKCYAERKFS
jgi:hypothetical protein